MKMRELGAIFSLAFCIFSVHQNAMADLAAGIAAYQQADFGAAIQELTPEAEHGNAEAQLYLGKTYENIIEGKQDTATAFKWYQMAAKQGNHNAEESLGMFYLNGNGVAKDVNAAMKWLQAAANGGSAAAQYQMGAIYSQGLGVPKNNALALKWFRLSADQHNAQATNSLSLAYQNGSGVKADKVLALALYKLSVSYSHATPSRLILNRSNTSHDLTEMDSESARNLFCALKNANSLTTALDAYVANPKNVPAQACKARVAQ